MCTLCSLSKVALVGLCPTKCRLLGPRPQNVWCSFTNSFTIQLNQPSNNPKKRAQSKDHIKPLGKKHMSVELPLLLVCLLCDRYSLHFSLTYNNTIENGIGSDEDKKGVQSEMDHLRTQSTPLNFKSKRVLHIVKIIL